MACVWLSSGTHFPAVTCGYGTQCSKNGALKEWARLPRAFSHLPTGCGLDVVWSSPNHTGDTALGNGGPTMEEPGSLDDRRGQSCSLAQDIHPRLCESEISGFLIFKTLYLGGAVLLPQLSFLLCLRHEAGCMLP